jgi:hypothetical protein
MLKDLNFAFSIFILFDIFFQFNKGYFDQGIYVKDRRSILKKCLKKKKIHFFIDLFLVIGLLIDNYFMLIFFVFKIKDINKIYQAFDDRFQIQ